MSYMEGHASMHDIWNYFKQLEGSVLSVQDNDILNSSKQEAKEYNKLFHCTSAEALLSIIKYREFWLNSLKWVNDKDEKKRIDVPKFENSYYVACFTYENQIPNEHWTEYGNSDSGVLFSVKKEWFLKDIVFMSGDNQKNENDIFTIYPSSKMALDIKIKEQAKGRNYNPFSIFDFDFYKIIYDDKLVYNIENAGSINIHGEKCAAIAQNPAMAGIIKKTSGLCERFGRDPYPKDWSSEKEIRLKIGIWQGAHVDKKLDFFFPKIAVKLSPDAFDAFDIRFSPDFDDERKITYLEELCTLLPDSEINILA